MGWRSWGTLGLLILLGATSLLRAQAKTSTPARSEPPAKSTLPQDLFVRLDPQVQEHLLEDWRWKVGNAARVFRVTVFGDVFTQAPGGAIYWLDTGSARYVKVAESAEQWEEAGQSHAFEWFHVGVLRKLLDRDVTPAAGQVYSWRKPPLLGGVEEVDNFDLVSAEVHVSHSGRLAEAVKDVPPGTKITNLDFDVLGPGGKVADDALLDVVVNEQMQYSLWPAGQKLPAGWKRAGKTGTKEECLKYIQAKTAGQ